MGGKNSRLKNTTRHQTRAAKMPIVLWKGVAENILPPDIIPLAIWQLIEGYWKYDIKVSFSAISNGARRWAFFNADPLPGLAADYLAEGNQDELEKLVQSNCYLLTSPVVIKDHRGTFNQKPLPLFVLALLLGDVFIQNKNNETMAGMLKRLLIDHHPEAELLGQLNEFHDAFKNKNETEEKITEKDKEMLGIVCQALNASAATNEAELIKEASSETPLGIAMKNFIEQLKQPGGDQIHQIVWERAYHLHLDPVKNQFFHDQIIRLTQIFRLPVCDLQMLYYGPLNAINQPETVDRIDVHQAQHVSNNLLVFEPAANHACLDIYHGTWKKDQTPLRPERWGKSGSKHCNKLSSIKELNRQELVQHPKVQSAMKLSRSPGSSG